MVGQFLVQQNNVGQKYGKKNTVQKTNTRVGSEACSDLVKNWPGIAVPPESAHSIPTQ